VRILHRGGSSPLDADGHLIDCWYVDAHLSRLYHVASTGNEGNIYGSSPRTTLPLVCSTTSERSSPVCQLRMRAV
jgi:hypothetical protein